MEKYQKIKHHIVSILTIIFLWSICGVMWYDVYASGFMTVGIILLMILFTALILIFSLDLIIR